MSGGVRDEYLFCNYIFLEDYHHKAGEFNLQPVTVPCVFNRTVY